MLRGVQHGKGAEDDNAGHGQIALAQHPEVDDRAGNPHLPENKVHI